MINIRLFEATATSFDTQGLGVINPISCIVTEELNGQYELEMGVPITDRHYNDIAVQRIVVCKSNPYEPAEPFRIYQVSRPIGGVCTVNAAHLSYDLSRYADVPFTASNITQAMQFLKSKTTETCPFTFQTDKSVSTSYTVSTPSSVRSLLGGSTGSILDVYGGEWKFSGYNCYLYTHRGQDRGVTIRYGKNLTDLKQDENCAKVYSKLYPYYADANGNVVEITGKTLDINQNGNGTLVYDMSGYFSEKPSPTELQTAAQNYIDSNNLSVPVVNLSVKFVQSDLAREIIFLGDTLKVEFPKLGVSTTAKVIRTAYNAMVDRYENIEVGDVRQTFAQTISELQANSVTGSAGSSIIRQAIDNATSLITGNKGGYVVLHDADGDGEPDELLIMNTPDILTAQQVWRWNNSGLGYSGNGYNGTYGTAITANGQIVADYVSTGTLDADLIKAGILQDEAGINSWNMITGEISLKALSEYGWNPQEGILQTYSGDDVLTNADDTIRAYSPATFTQIQNNSNEINILAGNAAGMQSQIDIIPGLISAAVTALGDTVNASLALEIARDSGNNPYGKISANADYISFNTGDLVINSSGFKLDANGNAQFNGSVTATSLTLGSGVTVPSGKVSGLATVATSGSYGDLTSKPNLTVYVEKGVPIGTTPAEGATGFKVENSGALTASNAIIWGTIYATNGVFSGTVSGSTITGSTFTSSDGKLEIDNDSITIKIGATATQRLVMGLENDEPVLIAQYWDSTSNAWRTNNRSRIGTGENGFSAGFYDVTADMISLRYSNQGAKVLAQRTVLGNIVQADRLVDSASNIHDTANILFAD